MHKKEDLVIFGVGQIAQIAQFYFDNDSKYKVAFFVADKEFIKDSCINKIPVIEYEQFKKEQKTNETNIFVAVAYSLLNKTRESIVSRVYNDGFNVKSYISTKSQINGEVKGLNNFILENNTIQPYSKIGSNNFIWSGNHIGHHTIIGDNNFISSHVIISGAVSIGSNNFLGVNSTVVDNITIGNKCIVGGGALVDKSLKDEAVMSASKSILHNFTSNKIKL